MINYAEITQKALKDFSDSSIIMPSDYAASFIKHARKKYSIPSENINIRESDLASITSAELLSGAIRGAEEVSESARQAVEAIEKHDSRKLEFLEAKMKQMQVEMEELREKAYLDGLTKAKNRSWMSQYAVSDDDKLLFTGVISFIDMNDFKIINDKYGHASGDNALSLVVASIKAAFGENNNVNIVRYGGDEFIVFANGEKNTERVDQTIEAVKKELQSRAIRVRESEDASFVVDFSFGSTLARAGENFNDAIERADKAMYASKINDKVSFAQETCCADEQYHTSNKR